MTSKEVVVGHRLGLHARASARLVRLSESFSSDISLSCANSSSDMEADARSILAILLLAAGHGTLVRVRADGEDEKEAVDAICEYLVCQ